MPPGQAWQYVFPAARPVARPTDGQHPAAPQPQTGLAAGGARRCPQGQPPQASQWPYVVEGAETAPCSSGVHHPPEAFNRVEVAAMGGQETQAQRASRAVSRDL